MTTKDTGSGPDRPETAPTAQDGANNAIANGNHAGDTVEVQGQAVPVEDEFDDNGPDAAWTPAIPPAIPAMPEGPESPEVSEGTEGPDDAPWTEPELDELREKVGAGVKVDARQEALVKELGSLLPAPDAPAEILQAFVDRILGRDRVGAELVLPAEPIEINREIECEIYAHRSMRLAGSPSSRTVLTLTFDGVRHSRLSGLLGANLKGRIRINVIDLQAPLEEDDEKELPDAGVVRQAELALQGRTPEEVLDRRDEDHREAYSVDNVGNVWRPHSFAPSPEDAAKCALCQMGEGHGLHEGRKRQAARTALRRRAETLIPHPFTAGPGEGPASAAVCVYCNLAEEDEIHVRGGEDGAPAVLSFADRLGYWRDSEGLEESIAWSRAEDDARDGLCLHSEEADRLAYKLLHPEAVWTASEELEETGEIERDAAAELGRPLRDDELTDEMRDARRRLAGAGD